MSPDAIAAAHEEMCVRAVCKWCVCVCVAAACVLLSNSAFVQASILVATMTPIIYKFYR